MGYYIVGFVMRQKKQFIPLGWSGLERKNLRGCVLVTEKNVNRKKSEYGIRNMNFSVRMTNFAEILIELNCSDTDRNAYIQKLCKFRLLIIDDLGMERGTDYGMEQVYNVIDARYRSGKL